MLSDSSLQACAEWLLYEEGFEEYPYDDETGKRVSAPEGRLTIGIGFNIQDAGLSMVESMFCLKYRINMLTHALPLQWPEYNHLDEVRQSVLINMAYNMGIGGMLQFKEFLLFLSVKDWVNASKAVLDSQAAIKEHNRYERISEAVLTGKFPNVINTHSDRT